MENPRIADAVRGLRHVFLRDLVLPARIGVHAHEHAGPQRVRINVDLAVEDEGARALTGAGVAALSRPPAGRPVVQAVGADELSRVVDYEAVANAVRAIVAAGHVQLVETLAERIAEASLADRRVVSARVRIEKLDIFPDATSAGVEVERRRR
jgi:dihydroneopterin aldolase